MAQLQVVPPTTFCESGGSPGRPAVKKKAKPLWHLMRLVSKCLDHGKCNRWPDVWPGFSWLGTSEIRGSCGHCHNWHMVRRLAPHKFSIFHQRWRLFLFPFTGVVLFFRIVNQETALLVNLSNSIIVTKTSKSSARTAASSVDSALPLAVVMTVGSFDLLMGSFSPQVSYFILAHTCGEMRRCPS